MRGGYRPNSGPAKGTKYKKRGDVSAPKPKSPKRKRSGIPEDIIAEAAAENMTPLDYMLKVMMDINADPARRDRMAVAAAPFVHPRKGEGEGKKEGKADRAAEAGKGKFAPSKPPLALVK
jgi:phage terminase small subunit